MRSYPQLLANYMAALLDFMDFHQNFISTFGTINLQWNRETLQCLGVCLGNRDFQKKNWEHLVEKFTAGLSKWIRVQPQLSKRGRVLVVNILIAFMLWHWFMVLEPPATLIREIQRRLLSFFWGEQHCLDLLSTTYLCQRKDKLCLT